jgi:hypothetical protein
MGMDIHGLLGVWDSTYLLCILAGSEVDKERQ